MATLLPVSTLPLDITAANPVNLVSNELHTNLNSCAVITNQGPFYGNTMQVVGIQTGGTVAVPLVLYQDYVLLPLFLTETAELGKDVYSYIVLTNLSQWTNVTLTYQAVGGAVTDIVLENQILAAGAFDTTQYANWTYFAGDMVPNSSLSYDLNSAEVVYNIVAKLEAVALALAAPSSYLNFITSQFTPLYNTVTAMVTGYNALATTLNNGGFLNAGSVRTRLTGPLTIYVSTTGNDLTGTGLTSNTAFASIQAAWNLLQNNYDINGNVVTIQMMPGTYTQGLIASQPLVGQQKSSQVVIGGSVSGTVTLAINSTGANTANSVITQHNFNVADGFLATIQNITLTNAYLVSGVTGNAINAIRPGTILVIGAGVIFGNVTNSHISSTYGAYISIANSYTISGNAAIHWYAYGNSIINAISGIVITLTQSVTFSIVVVDALFNSNIFCASLTFTLSSFTVTGTRYNSGYNSVIFTNSAGATYLPGTVGGTTSVGGQYA